MRLRPPRLPAIASALLAGAVCANALLFQDGRHPAPLFDGREAPRRVAANAATDSSQPKPPAAPSAYGDLVLDLQKSLNALGYYDGAIDGRFGPRTRESLVAYQRAHALEATGLPSAALLEHSRRQGRRAAPLPPVLPRSARATPET